MNKFSKCRDKISCWLKTAGLSATKQEKEVYLEEATAKNGLSFKILVIIIFVIQAYNMMRVLLLSDQKLGTLNNRIYFTMYLLLFLSGVLYLILERCFRHQYKRLSKLYLVVVFSWYLWHVTFSYYDLTRNPVAGITSFLLATGTFAMLFQCKPIQAMVLNLSNYVIFAALTFAFLDSGLKINISIVVLMSTVIAIRRYGSAIQMIRKKNELSEIHDEIRLKQKQLQASLHKQKVIMEYTNDIIFEWEEKEDALTFSNNVENLFAIPIVIKGAKAWLNTSTIVHPDDVLKLIKKIELATQLGQDCNVVLRIKEKNEKYKWYKARIFLQSKTNETETTIIGIMTDIDKQYHKLKQLETLSTKDLLTGLYNKITTEQKVDRFLKSGSLGVFYMIDIDNFKAVNDSFGHATGDEVLMNIATILKEIADRDDIVGRIGGDEFVLYAKNVLTTQDAHKKANQIIEAVSLYNRENEKHSFSVSVSVGVFVIQNNIENFQLLYRSADKALYQAKVNGKNQYFLLDKNES